LARNTEAIPHPLPPGFTKAFIDRGLAANSEHDIWVMDGSDHGLAEVLGVIALKRLDDRQSEISYWVAPAFWNTGFASESLGAIVEANPQGAEMLFGQVFQDNPASGKVLIHCGFKYLGDAEVFCVARDATVPTWTYLLKCE
jgi:RimJ/RimL family protein N-acetyltransferase